MSYKEEFTKASVEILNKAAAELNGLEKRLTDSVEQPGRPVQELTPIFQRLAEAALLCEKTIAFYSHEPAFPPVINRAVCRVQRAIPSLAVRGNAKGPGAPEPS